MSVALQGASGGDVDLGDRGRAADGHLVVKEETGGIGVGSFVFDWSLV